MALEREFGPGLPAQPSAFRPRQVLVVADEVAPVGSAFIDRQVGHELAGSGAVPVPYSGPGDHRLSGPDLLQRPAAILNPGHALGHVQRLALRMAVPGRAGAGCEVHAPQGDPATTREVGEPDHPGEPFPGSGHRLGLLTDDIHGQLSSLRNWGTHVRWGDTSAYCPVGVVQGEGPATTSAWPHVT